MKILVIENSPLHQKSALHTLVGHEVTILGSFDEFLGFETSLSSFDAVLTDMMMPMSGYNLPDETPVEGKEVPYGLVLALRLPSMGAKKVALVTDLYHHDDPICAALFMGQNGAVTIDGAKIIFVEDAFLWEGEVRTKDWAKALHRLFSD